MAKNSARMFAPIEKTEEQDDGTIKVWGYASAPTEDSDGEIITADAMKAALPDYLKFGAVREMHGKTAAGTAIEAEVQDDGRTWFGAHVVDTEACKKVRANVYKGFSIGGRVTARDAVAKTTITGLKLVEVSLVDRPANPDAVFTMFKAESELSAIDTMAKMINDGEITPERLLELAKADLTPEQEAVIAANSDAAAALKAEEIAAVVAQVEAPPVTKGMGNVAELAGLLRWISYMVADQAAENARENDTSAVPSKLKAWLADGIAIFQEMTAEETAELLANLPAVDADDGIVEMAAAADLEKAGARNSKSDASMLQQMHDSAVALGASCPEGSAKAATGDDLAKAELLTTERDEALAKAAGLAAEVETLTKRVTDLEAEPAPAKAALRAIGKGEDVIEITKDDDAIDTTGMTPEQIAYAEIKKLHKQGGKALI